MNTSKTLLAILVEELPKRGGWPEGARFVSQDNDAQLGFTEDGAQTFDDGIWLNGGDWASCPFLDVLASDYATAIITLDQYEAALAEKEHPLPWDEKKTDADGWITWAGGNLPVEHSALVDLKFRDFPDECGHNAGAYYWPHTNSAADIVAYRLHTAQQVEQPTAEQEPASNTDGWIEWAGGECPVDHDVLVDVKCRDNFLGEGEKAGGWKWKHDGAYADVVAYRLHQPQDANSRANDERLEADLNECIGQALGAPVWDGEGNPHIGAAVEWREGRRWFPGTVTAITDEWIIIKDQHGNEGAYQLAGFHIRPANFERDEIAAVIAASDEGQDLSPSQQQLLAKHLIAAGYRKQ